MTTERIQQYGNESNILNQMDFIILNVWMQQRICIIQLKHTNINETYSII